MKAKTEEELNRGVSRNEAIEHLGGWLVIAGLALEILIAFWFERGVKGFLETWSLPIANAIIAAGVYVEIHFGANAKSAIDNLRQISEEKVALLNAQTASANLELARLKDKISPRVLTPDQYEKLKALKGIVDRVAVTSVLDSEAATYALQIENALRAVGLIAMHAPPRFGQISSGVWIVLPNSEMAIEDNALSLAFADAGISSNKALNRSRVPMGDIVPDVAVIFVGEKIAAFESAPEKIAEHAYTLEGAGGRR